VGSDTEGLIAAMRLPPPPSRRLRGVDAVVGSDSAEQIGAGCTLSEERKNLGEGAEQGS